MFCTTCGSQVTPHDIFCRQCGNKASGEAGLSMDGAVPAGVKGWSWGAFLLNWIWAIGNRSWIGLLALLPYIGIFFAIWLGIKGREMAWKNKRWDSYEHFERVQKKWSNWGIGLTLGAIFLGIFSAIAIPAYQDYVTRAREMQQREQFLNPTPTHDSVSATTGTDSRTL